MSTSTPPAELHVCPIVGHCFGCSPREEREAEWMERTALPYATTPLLAALEAAQGTIAALITRAIETMPSRLDPGLRAECERILRGEVVVIHQRLTRVAEIVEHAHTERLPPTRYERAGADPETGAPSR